MEQDLSLSIESAEVHGLGVQIDVAIVIMGLRVESHRSLLEPVDFEIPTSLLRVK